MLNTQTWKDFHKHHQTSKISPFDPTIFGQGTGARGDNEDSGAFIVKANIESMMTCGDLTLRMQHFVDLVAFGAVELQKLLYIIIPY